MVVKVSSALTLLAFRVRSQQCWRWDADFSSSQGAERRYSEEATFAGATGIGGAGWFRSRPTRVRCPSRLRERRDCAQSLFFEVQLEFWDAAGPHDSELQKLMDFMEGSACADVLSALIPLAFRGRSQRCWRRDADFSSSQSAERRFG